MLLCFIAKFSIEYIIGVILFNSEGSKIEAFSIENVQIIADIVYIQSAHFHVNCAFCYKIEIFLQVSGSIVSMQANRGTEPIFQRTRRSMALQRGLLRRRY
jgi:hypothetical protein